MFHHRTFLSALDELISKLKKENKEAKPQNLFTIITE